MNALNPQKTQELSREMLEFHRLYNEKVSRRFRTIHSDTLSPVQYLLLGIIVEQKRLTMSELGDRALMQKQQLTKAINQLEERGLVVRTRLNSNRRIVWLEATPRGAELEMEIHRDMQAELIRIFSQLDENALNDYLAGISAINRILDQLPSGKGE